MVLRMAKAMREPTFWILTALAEQPLHGYGVMKAVARLSEQEVTLQAGTLYAALDRLTSEGHVEVDREEEREGRSRRYYRLTDAGAHALEAETERMRHNARAAARQLSLRPGFRAIRVAIS
jgi:PadR family transcriptional regulator, regulatory protein PadR